MNNFSSKALTANIVVLVIAAAWAAASHQYNMLNIGGAKGNVEFWIVTSDLFVYFGFVSWLVIVISTVWFVWWLCVVVGIKAVGFSLLALGGGPFVLFALSALLDANLVSPV